ncbi:MAG: type II toxin-antitoxin system RelE/ParE family toxin [Candidatus Limnocylindria bacterium]
MTLLVRVRQRAELDVEEAYAWYESRAEGLGEAFLRAVEACFARIARHPETHVIVHDRVRRARLHRFPYGVYYTTREDFIDVLAIYHGRRRPRRFDP